MARGGGFEPPRR